MTSILKLTEVLTILLCSKLHTINPQKTLNKNLKPKENQKDSETEIHFPAQTYHEQVDR